MKLSKLFLSAVIAASIAFTACGGGAEDEAAKEKRIADSMRAADSIANIEKAKNDSIAAAQGAANAKTDSIKLADSLAKKGIKVAPKAATKPATTGGTKPATTPTKPDPKTNAGGGEPVRNVDVKTDKLNGGSGKNSTDVKNDKLNGGDNKTGTNTATEVKKNKLGGK